MRKEFVRILKALDNDPEKDPEIESLRKMTLDGCLNVNEALILLPKIKSSIDIIGYSPHYYAACKLCKAIVQAEISTADPINQELAGEPTVEDEARSALQEFRSCGDRHNEGIAHWLLGVVYSIENDDQKLILSEIAAAIKVFRDCGCLAADQSKYFCLVSCDIYIAFMQWSLTLSYYQQGNIGQAQIESNKILEVLNLSLVKINKLKGNNPGSRAIIQYEKVRKEIEDCKAEILGMKSAYDATKQTDEIPFVDDTFPNASVNTFDRFVKQQTGPVSAVKPSTPNNSIPANLQPDSIQEKKATEAKSTGTEAHPEVSNEMSEEERIQVVFPWKSGWLSSRVMDFAHASKTGKFIWDDEPVGELSSEEVILDNEPHKVFHLRDGAQINLNPKYENRWIKVAGSSMNNASPIPINDGDYILAVRDVTPVYNNLVIARLKKPPTPDERAGVVKRLKKDGFYSESTDKIEPIPRKEASACGVVIAVAKKKYMAKKS